jgi:hypothetical protein
VCTELPGVQLRRLLEPDDHLTIRLPSLVTYMSLKMLGKSIGRDVAISHRLLVVGFAEGDDVLVGRELAAALERLHAVFRLAPQRGLDLLWHDSPTEYPGKDIADGDFEFSLNALYYAHVTARPLPVVFGGLACSSACRAASSLNSMVSGDRTHVAPSLL